MTPIFDDIPTFVAVVETGSFAAAARTLQQSRSAVAKAIARLEQRLGTRLFQRTTRELSLTDTGHGFFERCQRAMAELDAGRASIEAGNAAVTGKLRASMPTLFGRLHVAPVLLEVARTHPGLELDLQFSDRYVDVVAQGFDLCVRTDTLPHTAGLMTRRIAEKSTWVCASPGYLAHNGEPPDLAALQAHEKIAYTREGRTQVWKFPQADGGMVEIVPSTRYHLDDLGSLLDFALAGFGLAWLPDWLVAAHIDAGRLVRLFPQLPALAGTVQIVWPETPYLPRRVRVAIDALSAIELLPRRSLSPKSRHGGEVSDHEKTPPRCQRRGS